jgi:hypothetical protein
MGVAGYADICCRVSQSILWPVTHSDLPSRCEAIGPDRSIVRDLLQKLYETLRIRNTLRAMNILELHWQRVPTESGTEDGSFGEEFMSWQRRGPTDARDQVLDFIPY